MFTLQNFIQDLSNFWERQGCILHQGYDLEVGAGTFNPATFLRCLGPEPYHTAFVEPCRRPADGRYGENPNRCQHYHQFQVLLKPSPLNIQELYLESLEAVGFNLKEHDIRFVHDDWESPTLGAWGLGWEVWMNGMEITQFTYFQSVGGQTLKPVSGELTYGIERLALYMTGHNSFFDLPWNETFTYGDIFHRNEVEWSHYNFTEADTEMWFRHFDDYEREAKTLMARKLPIPAYDFVMKASHAFNLLDARGVISVTERTGYIARIRDLACEIAEAYVQSREALGFPLLDKEAPPSPQASACYSFQEPSSYDDKEDFVLEIGSEELPATFVPIGCRGLRQAMETLLKEQKLSYDRLDIYGTPRRLTAYVHGLALGKKPQSQERKGPPLHTVYDETGALTKAGEGFFRSLKREAPSREAILGGNAEGLFLQDIKGVQYLFATLSIPGQATVSLLFEQLPQLILSIDFPKSMRWNTLDISYARPLRWFVALHGTQIIPFSLAGLTAGRTTQGHRQRSPGSIELQKAAEYLSCLRQHDVLVDIEERKISILAQLKDLEKETNTQAQASEKVLAQVLHLSEYPTLMLADFDAAFLKAPKEVLISEMVEHQKYFPLAQSDGSLVPHFVVTTDNRPNDIIREGNQKVLSARLADGVFLYEQDLKNPLEDLNAKLKAVTFQRNLGSVYDKVERIRFNTQILCELLGVPSEKALRAATLCKADLASELVYEFPDLQGVVGRNYALAQGEDPVVAQAIDEHWMPRGEKAPLPQSVEGTIVSLADKIDNLLSCFSQGLKPTSSSDPYALRRQALGMIKILIENRYHLSLEPLLERCFHSFNAKESPIQEILAFFVNRIKTIFLDYGLEKDEIDASLGTGLHDIYDTFAKVQALHHFRRSNADFPLLMEVFKRARGQLQNQPQHSFSSSLLQEDAEKRLYKTLQTITPSFEESVRSHDYDKAYALIVQVQAPLHALFEEVHVLCDDSALRINRLALLQQVFALFSTLLDFSKLKALPSPMMQKV